MAVVGANGIRRISQCTVSEQVSRRAFFGVSALVFAVSAAVTTVWCATMSAMSERPMAGGWTMSMVWMWMPGQTWPCAAALFLGMWVVMVVAMMLPSLVPMLWRYRQAVGRAEQSHLGRLTVLAGAGYYFVWTLFGMAAFTLGIVLAAVHVRGIGQRLLDLEILNERLCIDDQVEAATHQGRLHRLFGSVHSDVVIGRKTKKSDTLAFLLNKK